MTPTILAPGDVVYVSDFPDENGCNTKTRRVVVVAVEGEFAIVLGASSVFTDERKYVKVPFAHDRKCRTTFSVETAVNVLWKECVSVSDCRKVGSVPPVVLAAILVRFKELNP